MSGSTNQSKWEWRFFKERDRRLAELAQMNKEIRQDAIREIAILRDSLEKHKEIAVTRAEFQPVEDYVTKEAGRLGGITNARGLLALGALILSALVNVYLVIRGHQ